LRISPQPVVWVDRTWFPHRLGKSFTESEYAAQEAGSSPSYDAGARTASGFAEP
jgi:hypothetical protein